MGVVELAAVHSHALDEGGRTLLTQPVSDVNRTDRSAVPGYLGFDVSVSHADGVAIVQVTGDLDCYTAPQLREALLGLIAEGSNQVILDVGQSSFIDSTGLGVLVGGLRRFRQEGGDMVLRSPTSTTIALLEVTGVIKLFEIT
jgi:anti-sigma B factor antagonist